MARVVRPAEVISSHPENRSVDKYGQAEREMRDSSVSRAPLTSKLVRGGDSVRVCESNATVAVKASANEWRGLGKKRRECLLRAHARPSFRDSFDKGSDRSVIDVRHESKVQHLYAGVALDEGAQATAINLRIESDGLWERKGREREEKGREERKGSERGERGKTKGRERAEKG